MKRRNLLQGMLALPVATALSSCRRSEPAKGTLRLILHGPWGVVTVRHDDAYRINAFVPSDPQQAHEFRFRTPTNVVAAESQGKRFRFELGERGLELSNRNPYRDHGFDDFNLGNIGEWRPEPEKYFIFLDLPAPDVITFIPPAEGVLFQDGRPGIMPLDQILEYRMHDANDVRLQSKDLGDQPPLSVLNLLKEYRKHWKSPEHQEHPPESQHPDAPTAQRPYIDADLAQYSNANMATFFFGVGLAEGKYTDPQLNSHAIQFFNGELLPAFFRGTQNASPQVESRINRTRLARTLGYSRLCQSPPFLENEPMPSPSPYHSPTVYREWMPQPHLQTVGSGDDCHLGGASAHAGSIPIPSPTPTSSQHPT